MSAFYLRSKSMVRSAVDLTTGWVKHDCVVNGYHLKYNNGGVEASIVTAPRGSGLMASNSPGEDATHEVWFNATPEPIGYLTLEEIRGIIKYLRHQIDTEL
jgi:hypothetical protein